MRGIPRTALLLAVLLWATSPAFADVVYLKNGHKIRGKIVARTTEAIVLELPYGNMTIPARQIERVEEENEDEFLRRTGSELIDLDDTRRGLEFLRKAWHQDPDSEGNRQALTDGLRSAVEQQLDARTLESADHLLGEAERVAPGDVKVTALRDRLGAAQAELARREQAARAALTAGDTARSHALLRELIADYPEARDPWREPLAESAIALGHAALRARQWSRASDLYHEGLGHDPDRVEALRVPLTYAEIRIAIPLFEQGDHRAALARLLRVHDLLPDDPAVTFYLALAHHGAGDLQEAGRLLRILAGPEGKTINGPGHLEELRLLAEQRLASGSGQSVQDPGPRRVRDPRGVVESRHFVIHNENRRLAGHILRFLEHHLRRLRRSWFTGGADLQLRTRIVVHLHPDRETFGARSGAPAWSRGFTTIARRLGLIRSVEIHLDPTAPQLLTSVIPHELAHALLPYRLGASVAVPVWLTEGVATLEETEVKQQYFHRIVREAHRAGALVPLAEFLQRTAYPADERQRALYYAQCNSVVSFLRKRLGRRRFFPALGLLAESLEDETLRLATGFDTLAHLERAWLRSMQNR